MESIAIITPTCNRAHLLEECVVSGASQTHPGVTVYVCDDGSTDDTDTLMESLCARFPNVRYLKNKYAKGQQGARQTALDAAEGADFIAFLDSDNRYHAEAVVRSLERFREKPETDVVFFGQICVRSEGVECMEWMREPIIPRMYGSILRPLLRLEESVDMGNGVIRKSTFDRAGGLDLMAPSYPDFELHIRLAQLAHYESIEEPLMDYLIHGNQITADPARRGRGLAHLMRKHKQVFLEAGGEEAWRAAMYRLLGHAKGASGWMRVRLAATALQLGPGTAVAAVRDFLAARGKAGPADLVEA